MNQLRVCGYGHILKQNSTTGMAHHAESWVMAGKRGWLN